MPIALIIIGAIMLVTGINNTFQQLGQQLKADAAPFTKWALAIFLVGMFGYADSLRTLSRLFMALIVASILLSQKGFIQNFMKAINAGPATIPVADASSSYDPAQALPTQKGLQGQAPTTAGEAKSFGWFNYWYKQLGGNPAQ